MKPNTVLKPLFILFNQIKIFLKTNLSKRPLASFFAGLILLLILIIAGNFLSQPKPKVQAEILPKTVSVYHIGLAPRLNLQAKVEKTGVITIVAQMGGVVQNIYHLEGETVYPGNWLVGLSTNYQGGNIFSLQRQMAEIQYNNSKDNYNSQIDLINKQRDLTNQVKENTDQLRDIAAKSIDDTSNIINLNNDIISTLNDNIDNLKENSQASPSSQAANEQAILGLKQMKSQFESANLQLNSALRNSQYQTDTDNPPTQLANFQKDITLKQLDLQEKALDLGKEISLLSLRIAQINESLMYPSAPFTGRIERIFVRPGQLVAPGTPLLLLSGQNQNNLAIIRTSDKIAKSISQIETSIFNFNGTEVNLNPTYISQEATDGQLYSVIFNLPDQYCSNISDGQYLSVSVPIGLPDTSATIPFIPLDAIAQTQEETNVFLIEGEKVVARNISLGNVLGRFVEITNGLNQGDVVILDRNVVAGDMVKFSN